MSRPTSLALAILFAAFAARVVSAHAYFSAYDAEFPQAWERLGSELSQDACQYLMQAREGRSDNAFANWRERPYYRPPLASYYFSYLFKLTAFDRVLAASVQALLAAAAYLVLYLLTARWLGSAVALCSLLVVTCHPILIFYDTSLEESPLAMLFLAAMIYCVTTEFVSKIDRWFLSGICAALLVTTRPNLVLAVFGCAALIAGQYRGASLGKLVRFAVPVLVAVGLCAFHNYRVTGEPSFITTTGGENLYWGNSANPHYAIWLQGYWSIPQLDAGSPSSLLAATVQASHPNASLDRAFASEALRFALQQPADFAAGLLRKAAAHLANFEIPRNRNFQALAGYSPFFGLPLVPYSVLLSLALSGVVEAVRRQRTTAILLLPWLASFASEVVFFNASRYRAVGIPFLAPLAVLALAPVVRCVQSGCQRNVVRSMLTLVASALLFWHGARVVSDRDRARYLAASQFKAAMQTVYADASGRMRFLDEQTFASRLKDARARDPGNLDVFSAYTRYLAAKGLDREARLELQVQRSHCGAVDWLCVQVCNQLASGWSQTP